MFINDIVYIVITANEKTHHPTECWNCQKKLEGGIDQFVDQGPT